MPAGTATLYNASPVDDDRFATVWPSPIVGMPEDATVTATVAVTLDAAKLAFPADAAVTVIVAEPEATAVTTPALLTVATLGAVVPYEMLAVGAPLGCVTEAVRLRVWPTTTLTELGDTATAVTAIGNCATVTSTVVVTLDAEKFAFPADAAVTVIVADPAPTAVTTPAPLTVATLAAVVP